MNILRKIAIGIGTTVAITLLVGLVAPKTAHAVVSALVTIANTPSNPVPTHEVKESRANFVSVSYSAETGSTYNEVSPDGRKTRGFYEPRSCGRAASKIQQSLEKRGKQCL